MNEIDTNLMESSIKDYDDYVRLHLSKMFTFQTWYEHSNGVKIPEEWGVELLQSTFDRMTSSPGNRDK